MTSNYQTSNRSIGRAAVGHFFSAIMQKKCQRVCNSSSKGNVSNVVSQAPKRTAGEVAMIPMGDLFVYEVMLGFCFVTIIMNWILM